MSRTASLTWEWRGVNVGFELENKLKSGIIIFARYLQELLHALLKMKTRLTHRYVDRSVLKRIPHQKIYRIPVILIANLRPSAIRSMTSNMSHNITMPALVVSESHGCRRKFQTLLRLCRGITFLGTIVRLRLVEGSVFIWDKPYHALDYFSVSSRMWNLCGSLWGLITYLDRSRQ